MESTGHSVSGSTGRVSAEGAQGRGSEAVKKTLIVLCLVCVAAAADRAKVTPLMNKNLTGIADKEATLVTVEYAPGASSAEHRHNAHTFVYVLEGSVVMQVKGGQEVTLGPGQTFYEP